MTYWYWCVPGIPCATRSCFDSNSGRKTRLQKWPTNTFTQSQYKHVLDVLDVLDMLIDKNDWHHLAFVYAFINWRHRNFMLLPTLFHVSECWFETSCVALNDASKSVHGSWYNSWSNLIKDGSCLLLRSRLWDDQCLMSDYQHIVWMRYLNAKTILMTQCSEHLCLFLQPNKFFY